MNAAILSSNFPWGWTKLMVYRFMKKAYYLRSAIVHGTRITPQELRVNGQQLTLDEVVMWSVYIVQQSVEWAMRAFEPGSALLIDWPSLYFPEAPQAAQPST